MSEAMPDWFQNPHADYVIVAYALAFVALAGLGLSSWLEARRTRTAWQRLQKNK